MVVMATSVMLKIAVAFSVCSDASIDKNYGTANALYLWFYQTTGLIDSLINKDI